MRDYSLQAGGGDKVSATHGRDLRDYSKDVLCMGQT